MSKSGARLPIQNMNLRARAVVHVRSRTMNSRNVRIATNFAPLETSNCSDGLRQDVDLSRNTLCARSVPPYTGKMNEPVHFKRLLARKASPEPRVASRTNDPERTMANILQVAQKEFAEKGLAGARIDEISDATQTSKRMIYYYFGSKEGLYLKVLEAAYEEMRSQESQLHLDDLEPKAALKRLVEYTFDHHWNSQGYIRLVMAENMNRGQYLAQSPAIQDLNVPAISAIQGLYDRGVASGVFRPGLDALDIHASISALTFFNVSNRHTFGLIFKVDTDNKGWLQQRRANVVDMVERYLSAPA